MKKLVILGALALGMCTNAFAYENAASGFSVKEGTPMIVFETADTIAYSNYSTRTYDSIVHNKDLETYTAIMSLSKKDMSEALEKPFSTALFIKELNKIELDKGKTDPKKLTKFADESLYGKANKVLKYLQETNNDDSVQKIKENVKVSVVKAGKGKALEFTNYASIDGNTYAEKTTVMSENDRIYTVTTIGTDIDMEKVAADKANKDSKVEESKTIVLQESDLDAVKIKKFKADHSKTLKSFKIFVPTAKKQSFGYNDSITKKFVELPEDWFYIKGNFLESVGNGHVVLAANYNEIFNAIKDVTDYRTQNIAKNADMNDKQYEDCLKLTLKNINKAKLSLDVKMSNNELSGMFGNPIQSKFMADQILKETFKRAKNFQTPYFALNDYDYSTWFSDTNGKINIEVLATFCKVFSYKGDFKSEFSIKTNSGSFTIDLNKVITKPNTITSEPAKLTFKNTQIQ